MLKYDTINSTDNNRVIIVTANDLMRYALYDSNGALKFKRHGSKAVAITHGEIIVFRKPNATQIHREYMAHNAKGLWLGCTFKGMRPEFERLISNMYELEGTI